jgi:hypothetical protein
MTKRERIVAFVYLLGVLIISCLFSHITPALLSAVAASATDA